MLVVPALLANDDADYRRFIDLLRPFAPLIQIDAMDGHFVPSSSVTIEAARGIAVPMEHELHLMVRDPLPWAEAFAGPLLRRVIVHAEAGLDLPATADRIRRLGASPGLALNPGTSVDDVAAVLPRFDGVLVMSVNPGFYGSPFLPEVLGKAARLRQLAPGLVLGVDGGVGPDTLAAVKEAGFDYACVGSRILLAPDPGRAYELLAAQAA